MTPYDFVHLGLHALGDKICGSTKLQKTIFFLGILTDNLDELGFRPHYYGPYSDAITAAVNRLKALGFLEETSLHTGMVGEDGFEVARHDFTLTDEGRAIARKKAGENPTAWKKIKHAANHFREAGDINYVKMSVAAKTFFMLSKKGSPASVVELSDSAKKFGWSPKPAEIQQSMEFLQKLGLAVAASQCS